MNLGSWMASVITEGANKRIIAIYPGRFQPFGNHHATAFTWLQKQFGADNTYITTGDKTDEIVLSPACDASSVRSITRASTSRPAKFTPTRTPILTCASKRLGTR